MLVSFSLGVVCVVAVQTLSHGTSFDRYCALVKHAGRASFPVRDEAISYSEGTHLRLAPRVHDECRHWGRGSGQTWLILLEHQFGGGKLLILPS